MRSRELPRLASTLILLAASRPTHSAAGLRTSTAHAPSAPPHNNFEVLMVERHSKARFMPLTYVFPGGGVDPEDVTAAAEHRHGALRDSWLAQEPDDDLAFRLSALRELAEETHCILSRDGSISAVGKDGPMGGEMSGGYDVGAAPRLTPLGRWVTPSCYRYRYDTAFWGAIAYPGSAVARAADSSPQEALLRPQLSEINQLLWISPRAALQRHSDPRDDFMVAPPTFLVLRALAAQPSLQHIETLWEAESQRPLASISPVVPDATLKNDMVDVYSVRAEDRLFFGLGEVGNGFPPGRYRFPTRRSSTAAEMETVTMSVVPKGGAAEDVRASPVVNLCSTK